LQVLHRCYDLPGYCPCLENLAHGAEEKLKSKKVLAIVGMGGIGKTTIAKQLFNSISGEYEYTCFLDNAKGIHDVQQELLDGFHHNGIKVKRGSTDWSHLKGKKTLLVMDDVDSGEELSSLPQSLSTLGNGSHLIVTSRNRDIVKHPKINRDADIYDVGLLKEDDAMKLFCHHAFSSEEVPFDYLLHSVKKLVEKCEGLPLTLEVLGCYLRGEESESNLDIWKDAIKCLEDAEAVQGGAEDKIWARLRISYDKKLSAEEKEMFIDAATFFFGRPSEEALAAWSTAYGKSSLRGRNLLNTCMVKEKEVDRYTTFDRGHTKFKVKEIWVHEHLRDLANKISKGEITALWHGVDQKPFKVIFLNRF
jgi:hypothetical protein